MSFKVIDGDGPGKDERERERERQWAKQEFSQASREVAANMLRIIRGAGKPYDLLLQMKRRSTGLSNSKSYTIIGLAT